MNHVLFTKHPFWKSYAWIFPLSYTCKRISVTTSSTGAPDLKLTNFSLSRSVPNGLIYLSKSTSFSFWTFFSDDEIWDGRKLLLTSVIFSIPASCFKADVFFAWSALLRHHFVTAILLDAKDLILPMSFKKKRCLGKTILLKK